MVIKIRGDQKLIEENRKKFLFVVLFEVCKLKCLTHLFGDVWDCKRVRRVKNPFSGTKMKVIPFTCRNELLHLRLWHCLVTR